jgi:hypothetical protein
LRDRLNHCSRQFPDSRSSGSYYDGLAGGAELGFNAILLVSVNEYIFSGAIKTAFFSSSCPQLSSPQYTPALSTTSTQLEPQN